MVFQGTGQTGTGIKTMRVCTDLAPLDCGVVADSGFHATGRRIGIVNRCFSWG